MTDAPPISPEREALEQDKLRAEIAKLGAEQAIVEFNLGIARRQQEWELSQTQYVRTLPFWGEIHPAAVAAAVKILGEWSRKWPEEAMTLQFNSPGGSVVAGLAFYDYIQQLRAQGHHITTVGIGMVASMGGVLLQAGDRRVMGPNSHLLIHEITTEAWGKMSEIEDATAFSEMLQGRLVAILASRSTMSEVQIRRKWKRKDWWMGAEQAVELGFADEVR